MGPIRSGTNARANLRASINIADSVHPNDTNPTAANTFRQQNIRARDSTIAVWTDRDEVGVSVTVTVYVSKDGTGAQATAGSWRRYGRLNAGAAITPTSPAGGTTYANRIYYSETIPGLCGWPYVYCEVTGTLAIDEVPDPDVGYTHVELITEDE